VSTLLGIETSSETGSVAVYRDGLVAERSIATPREQTAQLLPYIRELLAEAGAELHSLDAIVFGRGPGSFTGLRIAAAISQGLAMAARLPVIAVSSLAATAQHAWDRDRVAASLVCIDARMGEVYWARFEVEAGLARLIGAEAVSAPEAVQAPETTRWAALGGAFTAVAHAQALESLAVRAERVVADIVPRAQDLFPQARADLADGRVFPAAAASPVYLRDATAWRR
jgi:tRNA threonylcarbamoyladenosine biosynthesis protein TsaB